MKTYFLIITVAYFAAISWQGSTPQAWQPKQTRIDVRQSENLNAFLMEYNQAKQQLNKLQQDSSATWYVQSVDTVSMQP